MEEIGCGEAGGGWAGVGGEREVMNADFGVKTKQLSVRGTRGHFLNHIHTIPLWNWFSSSEKNSCTETRRFHRYFFLQPPRAY